MNKFLDTYNHLKLNQEYINHLNRSSFNKEVEAAIDSLKHRTSRTWQNHHWFLPDLLGRTNTNTPQLIHENKEEGTLPNSFYEANITLNPIPDKYKTKEENYKQSL
jgi:hypothetical protein